MEGIYHNCTDIWKNIKGVKKSILIEWGYKVTSKIDEKMKIPLQTSCKYSKNVLQQQKKLLRTLDNIHNEFVITPNDKAIGNVAFICQRLFLAFCESTSCIPPNITIALLKQTIFRTHPGNSTSQISYTSSVPHLTSLTSHNTKIPYYKHPISQTCHI